ncbi:MAG TPA: aromatic amino acid aminotransferase [Lentisphaeria bacterium]|nr:MAG: aromatic amino acid aminotransferase [Lentisphaerae bacterium GWF2_38_69]HBM17239.1 aromatic amino acid aminotransferase [Lentisphaeria bacterium]
MFKHIQKAPADPILGLNDAFKNEKNPAKINLGVGVYKNEAGETPVLECVKKSEAVLISKEKTKSYLPIDGTPEYVKIVKELVFGKDSALITEKRIATIQSPGGTGALRIGADFIKKFFPKAGIWISDPTWENHRQLFGEAGIEVHNYPYYCPTAKWLDFENMKKVLSQIPSTDVVLLHACCHNPTGVDLTHEQWNEIAKIAQERGFIVFFDFAYQGFGNGPDEDAYAVRFFSGKIKNFLVANSYSKNFGLYNERIGALSVVTETSDEAEKVLSQLKICARVNYSNPPGHGSSIVTTVLSDPELTILWNKEVTTMRERILAYRLKLVEALKAKGVKQDFSYIAKQLGMFSYTGLSPEQVKELREKFAIYMVNTGRINLAGLNEKNLDAVASAIASVVK